MNSVYDDPSIELSQEDFALPEGIGLDSLDCKQWFELNEATFGIGDDDDLFQ
jgi:hypothetical protein